MNFAYPQALYFILPVIFAVLGLAVYARGKQRRAAAAFADAMMSPRILPPDNPARFWCKLALWEAALVLSLLAIARPQWGEIVEEVKVKGSDLYVLIDVSRSMLATDVAPSRLERAKSDVSELLNRLKGERVGLIAFAGRAAIACPLTADYPFFRARLTELGPNSVDRGGTLIGDAIRKALSVLPEAPDRDQALLVITDGDDQESEPLTAAAQAAERHIAVFTVGLGNPAEGARVPEKEGSGRFLIYEGKEVVSKMDDDLLRKIALQTGGAYVPARTTAYDLGKLYEEKLSQLRGDYAKELKRRRMAERFEIPLALALICFTLELLIRPYRQKAGSWREDAAAARKGSAVRTAATALILFCATGALRLSAADAHDLVNEGLKLYAKKDYDAAGEKFTQAESAATENDREAAARAAFDAGCAFQRKGDVEKATEALKKATLARDKALAAAAHFNMGELSANAAKDLAGAQPETIPPDKREEILNKLVDAVGHYRNCVDIQPEHAGARKNIELVRQWIKLYTNKWAELDRKKRREDMNLLQYLEFLAKTQRALREQTLAASEYASADEYAEWKRLQDELADEIEPLKEKLEKDTMTLGNYMDTTMGKAKAAPSPEDEKRRVETVKSLQKTADTAGEKMRAASQSLHASKSDDAAVLQKEAATTLDQVWEAISPFMALIQRDVREETQVVDTLKPPETEEKEKKPEPKKDEPKGAAEKKDEVPDKEKLARETAELAELQADVSRRTMQLKFRAVTELAELEKNTPKPPDKPAAGDKEQEKEWLTLDDVKREEAKKKAEEARKKREEELKKNGQPPEPAKDEKNGPPSPEEIKKGLEKAVELAPKAVEKINSSLEHLKKGDRTAALPDADAAKKILQEILDAQPKQKGKDQQQDEKEKKEQEKKQDEQKKQDAQKKQDEQKSAEEKKKDEEKKKEDEKKKQEQDKKDQQKKDEHDKDKQEKDKSAEKQPMTKEQAEAMLRKVRERELDHRKKKQEEIEAIMGRRQGVEKDW